MKSSYNKGLTVIEVIVVVAIVAILVAVTLPQFSKMRENQAIKNAVADTVSVLNKARSYTLASVESSEYGVHFQSDKVIIFKGTTYSTGIETVDIITPATISTISLSGGGSDVYFSRLSGAPSKTGTITISSTNFSKVITISATGGVSFN
jgi:prepilin-type N-terminal cleavage/methylation domain-containing protein